jgi:hypothetical protein
MKKLLVVIFLITSAGCQKKYTRQEIVQKLSDAFSKSLYERVHNDSSKVKYYIKDVIFYDDRKYDIYLCEFKVRMVDQRVDTTGIMGATISKDFTKVIRKY